jgi:hypothetical protein
MQVKLVEFFNFCSSFSVGKGKEKGVEMHIRGKLCKFVKIEGKVSWQG